MASSARNHPLVITLLLMLTCLTTSSYSQEPEAILLLKFKSSLTNTTSLSNWNLLVQLCNGNVSYWNGLLCFNGELPDDAFAGMKSIRRILMANNEFTGKIPTSLMRLPELIELQLQDNQFDGRIPAFTQQDFQLNVSYNRLEGPIPPQLSSQSASSFEGNLGLCGKPMPPCPPSK